ncbi:hypothetical protein FN846DRAFT_722193 [Sphaerosporella brunnea]|uniref:Uncharacterized protein n=1 Tax=Sphaerosporella brunnea TaxID=1250544 RepID=A0A5J5EWZ2_9PEZI|nr:hypothetical protein FN846DRAFT_722193 [Sphaerosporella brunnea]
MTVRLPTDFCCNAVVNPVGGCLPTGFPPSSNQHRDFTISQSRWDTGNLTDGTDASLAFPAENSTAGRILKLEQEFVCQNIEIKESRAAMDRRFNGIKKRFDNLESWIKLIIGFGVGTVGLSIGTVRFQFQLIVSIFLHLTIVLFTR